MCEIFIQKCVRTTFPEHRQHFMKAIKQFLMRLRNTFSKEINKFVANEIEISEDLNNLVGFLSRIILFCEENLYVDKPIETALPLFEILKMI